MIVLNMYRSINIIKKKQLTLSPGSPCLPGTPCEKQTKILIKNKTNKQNNHLFYILTCSPWSPCSPCTPCEKIK